MAFFSFDLFGLFSIISRCFKSTFNGKFMRSEVMEPFVEIDHKLQISGRRANDRQLLSIKQSDSDVS
jgi:hypothetical protein